MSASNIASVNAASICCMIPASVSGVSAAPVIDPAMPDKAEAIAFRQASATRLKG
jgi:hypothetical protein